MAVVSGRSPAYLVAVRRLSPADSSTSTQLETKNLSIKVPHRRQIADTKDDLGDARDIRRCDHRPLVSIEVIFVMLRLVQKAIVQSTHDNRVAHGRVAGSRVDQPDA